MIIDTHTHFYDPYRPEGVPWPSPSNKLLYRTVLPEHLKPLAVAEGVTGTVVVEASRWLEDNQWILDLAQNDPFIVGFVSGVVPNQPSFPTELARFAASPLFRGIRVGGNALVDGEQGTFLDDMALLAARDLSLDVLVGDPSHFAGLFALAERVPDLRIVINHVGNMKIDGTALTPDWSERFRKAATHPNVYMKVSGLLENSTVQPAPTDVDFYRPLLDCLWDAFGEERLIFGSNWPVCEQAGTYAGCVSIVRSYFGEKGEEASANYFWRNAKRVYKWIERM
ncbi:MAG: amidohydrolase family protein [Caldilineaceae bacterium]|nr:amidohydrolase family protein [Caldilineaceae bacterium]